MIVRKLPLEDEALVRIDALAPSYGLTREEMIVKLLLIGLPLMESEVQGSSAGDVKGEAW